MKSPVVNMWKAETRLCDGLIPGDFVRMRATTAPVLKTDAPAFQITNLRIHDEYPPVAMLGLYSCGNRMSIA